MKKSYNSPLLEQTRPVSLLMQIASLTGNTGDGNTIIDGNGDEDNGGEGDPDAKSRGGIDGWGNLW